MASTARIEELRKKYEENQRRYFAPLANEYRKAGQLEEAIALCRAWLPQQPGHMSGHIVFGQTLFEAGELSEARSVFETALELDPENLIALRHLGDIARQHGEIESARSWYRRVLDADPRNDEISALLAQLDSMPASGAQMEPAPASETPSVVEIAAEVHTPVLDASIEVSAQADTGETTAWAGTGAQPDEMPADVVDEAVTLFETAGTVAFQDDTSPLDDQFRQLAIDAAASMAMDAPPGTVVEEPPTGYDAGEPAAAGAIQNDVREEPPPTVSAASELGLEVMEFVPPPRDATRAPIGDPSPFDGHLLTDDADGSGATPAAFVTETMAELYLQQGFRDEALAVYKQLLQQNPEDEGLRERVAQLESGSRSSVGMAAISDEVIASAQRRQVAHTPPSMRAFLAKLAVRRAPRREADQAKHAPDEGDETGSVGAAPQAGEPDPDSGGTAVDSQHDAWQLPPDESTSAAGDDSPYADGTADAEADTAEWIADDDSRLSASGDESAAASDRSLPAAEDPRRTASADVSLPDVPAGRAPTPTGGAAHNGAVGGAPASTPRAVGAVGSLFAGAVVQASDEAAASALASAFAPQAEKPRDAMVGRPTRAAKSEISLDHVFRESGSRPAASKERSSFSFDQFFSETASGSPSANEEGSATPDDASGDDIEQFNSWLEGLKKK